MHGNGGSRTAFGWTYSLKTTVPRRSTAAICTAYAFSSPVVSTSTASSESSARRRRAQAATCSRSRVHDGGRRRTRIASSRSRWASRVPWTRHSGLPPSDSAVTVPR
ncbi:hypothetical protein ACFQ3Z_37355 [Streptomyces nogalater]